MHYRVVVNGKMVGSNASLKVLRSLYKGTLGDIVEISKLLNKFENFTIVDGVDQDLSKLLSEDFINVGVDAIIEQSEEISPVLRLPISPDRETWRFFSLRG